MRCSFFTILLILIPITKSFGQKKHRKIISSYGYETTQINSIKTTSSQAIQTDKFYLNSKSNALIKGGKNRTILPVHLPENTVEWCYRFNASRNIEDINNTLNSFNLASELTQYLKNKNPLQNAVQQLTTPPGANICDIYIFNEHNAKLFKEKKEFHYNLSASRENYKSGNVLVKTYTKDDLIFIGINNPDNLHGVHVSIEIVAIVLEEKEVIEQIKIPIYTSFLE